MDLVIATPGTSDSPADTCIGQSEVDLSSTGFIAIQQLATSWSGPPPRFLFASDLRRAQQSAQVFASHFATEPLLDGRLRDQHMGRWQGQCWDDIATDDHEHYRNWRRNPAIHPAPGGESFSDLLQRTSAWLAALQSGIDEDDTVLAVAHASTLRALLCHTIGLPPRRNAQVAACPARASLIRCRQRRFEVCWLNASSFQTD